MCVYRIIIDDVMNLKRNDEMHLKGTGGNRVKDGNYEKVKIKNRLITNVLLLTFFKLISHSDSAYL